MHTRSYRYACVTQTYDDVTDGREEAYVTYFENLGDRTFSSVDQRNVKVSKIVTDIEDEDVIDSSNGQQKVEPDDDRAEERRKDMKREHLR